MGDAPAPPLVAATSNHDVVTDDSSLLGLLPARADKTATSSPPSSTLTLEPQLGHESAMFSTDLGKRASRKLQGPPYAPVIVRSNRVQDVLVAAGVWHRRYPQQYLSIFPRAGWQIGDLWDEFDIHLETQPFCAELLQFIEHDVYIRAKNFAYNWSRMHPERLHIVGGDMTDLYDKSDHLSLVDKVFVNDEQHEFPPVFLWHVAHIMRTAMLEVKNVKPPVKTTVSLPENLGSSYNEPVEHSAARGSTSIKGTATLPTASSTRAISTNHIVVPSSSVPILQPTPMHHDGRPSPRVPANGPANQGGRFAEPMGHVMAGIPEHQMSAMNVVHPGLRVPKNRPRRSGSGSYDQGMPSNSYIENIPHGPSGSYLRHTSGPMSVAQSPRLNQAPHMAMQYPMASMSHGMAPFAYEQSAVTLGVIAGHPPHPGIMHPGMMPLHSMQNPSMMHGYARQASGPQVPPHGAPMGDMTNMYFSPGIPPQNMDHRRPGDRRYGQQHEAGSSLYDPYEGSNPAFRTGKRMNQNGFQNGFQHNFQGPNGRNRKTSAPGSRPYHNQYTNDRPSHMYSSGPRFPGPKGLSEDDLAITQDHEHGCHIDWIGPQNTTVNELFVKDLPENIQDVELERLFQDAIGVKPKSVNAKSALQPQYNYAGRKHAFVGFSTTAVARQALHIRSPTIRGLPVSITVPKRFFQKIVEAPMRDATEAGPSSNSRYISHVNNREARSQVPPNNASNDPTTLAPASKENPAYSPQDARSDLHKKKKKGKQPQQGSTASGSPEVPKTKSKKRQEWPSKKESVQHTEAMQDTTRSEIDKIDDEMSAGSVTNGALPILGAQIEQSQANKDLVCKSEEEISPTAAADAYALLGEYTLSMPKSGSPLPTNQQQTVNPQQVNLNPQHEVQKVNVSMENAKPGPAKASAEKAPLGASSTDTIRGEDVASDDDLKNDLIFHSAAESRSDLEQKVEQDAGPGVANHGSSTPSPRTTKPSPTRNISPVSRTISESDSASRAPENHTAATATGNSTRNSESTDVTMAPAELKPDSASVAMQRATASSPASPSTAGAVKKGGAQHTESLHPFSKASKIQAKKDREQKRKAQKKEKEQAEKARLAKAAAIKPTANGESAEKGEPGKANGNAERSVTSDEIKLAVDSKSADNDTNFSTHEVPPKTTPQVDKSSAPAETPVKPANIGNVDGRDKAGKREDKKTDNTVASVAAIAESKSDDPGKQPGGTTNIPNEVGSVIKKEVKFALPVDDLASDAQSSNLEDTTVASIVTKESELPVTKGTGLSKSAKKRKKRKLRRVWPSLEFRPKSPNPEWMGPIDMEADAHNYDSIINEACGEEDDSDFSWDDLPRQSSSGDEISSSASDEDENEGEDGDETKNEILKRIADLETQQAATTLASMQDTAQNLDQQKQTLGNALYLKVQKMHPEHAGKITHMLLELDNDGLVDLISDQSALRAKVDEAMSIHDEHIKNKGKESDKETLVESKRHSHDFNAETEATNRHFYAGHQVEDVGDQTMIKEDLAQRIDTHGPHGTVAAESQPAKKKKSNKHKKRKKQQQHPIAEVETAEPTETIGAADAVISLEHQKPTSAKATNDPIDIDDPFYNQLKDIDAIKGGEIGVVDIENISAKHHAEIAKSLKDPQFMRTMEGYLKETQGTGQTKGRKVSKEDLL